MVLNKSHKLYRAGLIGCGSMGSYYMDELVGLTKRAILPVGHAEVLKTHPQTELIAGADPHQGRLEDFGRRWEISNLYTDHQEMLERECPEIVSIASPPTLHAQHVIDCAERGVAGIFCEKPLTPTLREADEMIRACEANGVRLCINHTRRGDPYVHQALRLLKDGAIGDVLTITITWAGRLFLTGTHSYDLANYLVDDNPTAWLIGHVEEPTAQMTVVPTRRGVDVGGTTYGVYQNGVRAFFNGRDGNVGFRTDIFGTKGVIRLDDNEAELWKNNQSSPFRELLKHRFPQAMRYTAPMVYLLQDLLEAVESGRDPVSNGGTARRALEQILATHYSSQHDNCKVHFPIKELEVRIPFQWFGSGGQTLYHAVSEGVRD